MDNLYTLSSSSRNITLDIIRTVAILCVIGVHSFSSPRDYCFAQSILRTISVLGVPLFLLLSGYLNSGKSLDDYYTKGKWKTFIPNYFAYVILGGTCYVCSKLMAQTNVTLIGLVRSILDFSCTPYGWYMEMWIGLFFLTPFLNIILKAVTQKQEVILIVTILAVSQIAATVNRNGTIILPSFWQSIWPISFYFTGHYIRNFCPRIRLSWCILLFILSLTIEYVANITLHTTNSYLYLYGGHDMIVYYIIGVLLFVILLNSKTPTNKFACSVFVNISCLSFFMYLISAAFDKTLFHYIEHLYETPSQFMPYRIIVYICTVICAFMASWCYSFIDKFFKNNFIR